MQSLNRALSLASDLNFFSVVLNKKGFVDHYKLGPLGSLLRENIRTEWLNSNLLQKDFNVYLYTHTRPKSIQEESTFCPLKVLKESNHNLPVGYAEIYKTTDSDNSSEKQGYSEDATPNFFQPNTSTVLKTHVVLPYSDAMKFYLHWQRQKKIWWSKICTSPGLFSLGDIKLEGKVTNVDIISKFPWGDQTVESITLNFLEGQKIQHGRKSVSPAHIVSTTRMEAALLCLFCDSLMDVSPDNEEVTIKLHRKMAPYKFSYALTCKDSSTHKNLQELAVHLNYKLRVDGISTLLPDFSRKTLEYQFRRFCELGIPYTIILSEETLNTGILHLLSRDTTLKEQVHIADLCDFVKNLLRSF